MNDAPVPALDAALRALLAPYDSAAAPGGVLAVSRHGRLLAQRAVGLAQVEAGMALQATTRLPIGSITKQFTCAALLLLADEGRLALDDSVGRWLPGLPSAQQAPTLRQAMTHTAGIRCYLDQWMFDGYRTLEAGVPWALQGRQQTANFAPGTASCYSNGGYLLLTRVVERAAGVPLGRFLHERVFAPLGLLATRLPASRWPLEIGVAQAYLRARHADEHGWRPAPAMTEELFGDGGMVSSAGDLLRWAQALREGFAGLSVQRLGLAPGYGFGLITEHWRGRRVVQHAGGLPGANSALLMLPDDGLDIVALFNRPAPATELALKLAEAVLGDTLPPAPPAPRAAAHQAVQGRWLAPGTGWLFDLAELPDGALGLGLFGDAAFALEACAPQGARELPFHADVGTGEMRFRGSVDGEALEYFDGVAWHAAQRLAGEPPDAARIAADCAGLRFRNDEVGATLQLALRSDGDEGGVGGVGGDRETAVHRQQQQHPQRQQSQPLQLHVQGPHGNGRYAAEPIAPDLLRFWPPLFPAAKLLRLQRRGGAVTALVVSTGRTRATVFEREPAR